MSPLDLLHIAKLFLLNSMKFERTFQPRPIPHGHLKESHAVLLDEQAGVWFVPAVRHVHVKLISLRKKGEFYRRERWWLWFCYC